jgi:hypothetical protein
MSVIVFAWNFVINKNCHPIDCQLSWALVIGALLFEIILTNKIKSIDKERDKWKQRWEEEKKVE